LDEAGMVCISGRIAPLAEKIDHSARFLVDAGSGGEFIWEESIPLSLE
jgi:hypothetical protein